MLMAWTHVRMHSLTNMNARDKTENWQVSAGHNPKEIFAMLDEDHDGVLVYAELKRSARSMASS